MATKKLNRSEDRTVLTLKRGAAKRMQERKLRRLILRAYERAKKEETLKPPELYECDPLENGENGKKDKTLNKYLQGVVGPYLMQMATLLAAEDEKYEFIVGQVDASRQNPKNHLGGREYGGEAAMKAYWDAVALTVSLLAGINGSERVGTRLARVSPTSDEGVTVIGGMKLTEDTMLQFKKCWEFAREKIGLCGYTYEIPVKNPYTGETETFALDLKAFSRVLRHSESIVACSASISQPIKVRPNEAPDFVLDELRKLENAEVDFYHLLPRKIKGNGGLSEVKTPFSSNLFRDNVKKTKQGCFVEIKIDYSEISREMLEFTTDNYYRKGLRHVNRLLAKIKESRRFGNIAENIIETAKAYFPRLRLGEKDFGTRKGFAEIYSGLGGMRFLNTFLGKARANRVLTPIAQAMGDLNAEETITPVSGGYLQYHVDYEENPVLKAKIELAVTPEMTAEQRRRVAEKIVRESVEQAIKSRTHVKGIGEKDKTRLDMDFEPTVSVIDATDFNLADVRARFILDSLGKTEEQVSTLAKADFLLNFFENVNKHIQNDIYNTLGDNGDCAITEEERRNIQLVRWVCSRRRTIRDVEDLVWTLRRDEELPDQIKAKKEELEAWVFKFAKERYEKMFYLLATKIQREMGR